MDDLASLFPFLSAPSGLPETLLKVKFKAKCPKEIIFLFILHKIGFTFR